MARQYSIAQARDHLPAIVHQVEGGEPVELTRRGKPVAVVVSMADFRRVGGPPGFAAALEAFRAATDPRDLRFIDEEIEGLRVRAVGRDFRWQAGAHARRTIGAGGRAPRGARPCPRTG